VSHHVPDAIGKAIKKYLDAEKQGNLTAETAAAKLLNGPLSVTAEPTVNELINMKSCPECGNAIQFESGCVTCAACGYSKCG
jgi:ribonucleoside-diphosphate reductase alpha chain